MSEMNPNLMTRRDLLLRIRDGSIAGALAIPLLASSAVAVDTLTNFEGGNAEAAMKTPDQSKTTPGTQKDVVVSAQRPQTEFSVSSADLTLPQKVSTGVAKPLFEEATFRAIPSKALGRKPDEAKDGRILSLTKRELLLGGVTTTIFAGLHNLDRNFSTKFIPVPQFIFGGLAWCLQRRRGYAANAAAHMTVNGFVWFL